MKKKLILFPCSGNAFEAVECAQHEFDIIGFVDDNPLKQGVEALGIKNFQRNYFADHRDAFVLALPGSPTSYEWRQQIIDSLQIDNNRFATIIHPKASVSKHARIGYNTLIMAGAVITSNAIIGNHVMVLPNTVIHHDTIIGDYTCIGSNVTIAGNVMIGNQCYIGSGSSIINGIEIAAGTLVGIGSNVIKSVNQKKVIVGNPAREIVR